jgi:Dyp-type peroxidase family
MNTPANLLQPVREAPAGSPLAIAVGEPAKGLKEPPVKVSNIQGNIIGGFKKDHQMMLFLRLRREDEPKKQAVHVENFRKWLAIFEPNVSTSEEVLAFNRLFKSIRTRRRAETRTVQATWINIAFSFDMLKRLSPDAEEFTDNAFREGMAQRAVKELADPADPNAEGNPTNWVFGGPGCEADVVIIVASDDPGDLAVTIDTIETSIYGGRTPDGKALNSGVQIIYKQRGATLPPPLTGHEHFGWLDGVSQPGIRGRIETASGDFITPRQNPNDENQGKPGQDLLWPGEFVFSYSGQKFDPTNPEEGVSVEGPNSLTDGPGGKPAGPSWAQDGSYLVVRRLRQDVARFHEFLEEVGDKHGVSSEEVGARLVGRWKSGAPVMRATTKDDPRMAENDCVNNHFEFEDATQPIVSAVKPEDCVDNEFPQSQGDPKGEVCPFAAHIRKAYPRDDSGTLDPSIGEVTTQTHRLLRRGIPFGDPFYAPKDPEKTKDSGNRGLLFAAYQTSLVDQFEFVQKQWVNNPDFKNKRKDNGDFVSGHDLIIGQSNEGGSRERRCPVHLAGAFRDVVAPQDWVIPTGGGYFFAPSISALKILAGVSTEKVRATGNPKSRHPKKN